MTAERNAHIMRTYLAEVVGNGRLELLPELAADDMVDHVAVEMGWGTGRHGLAEHVRRFRDAREEITIDIVRIVAADTDVVGHWRCTSKVVQPVYGVPADGRRVEFDAISIFRIENDRIVDYYVLADRLAVVRQLGVPIAPPQAAGEGDADPSGGGGR